jgi:hypothetical protein
LPAAWVVWLVLALVAIVLNATRPTIEDPRWFPPFPARFPDGDAPCERNTRDERDQVGRCMLMTGGKE